MKPLVLLSILGALSIKHVASVSPTDEYRDADLPQSGYLPNHNMDPNVVNSASFGQLWKIPFNNKEQFYAKPLTYTPLAGGPQILFLASTMNYIRTLDAKTGALINSRQVHTPFLQSDIPCADIPNYIGIVGTPTIDPATDIVYFFSKTYIPNFRVPGNTGVSNGVYYFHAVNINTLADVYPPLLIDGTNADNAPQKYFVGGVILQRPSLIQIGNVVYGAFGGHCDLFNYTGVIIGVDVIKATVITQFAIESGPLVAQTNNLLQNGGGGEGGIWMSGMSLASDGQRLFAVTGNSGAHQNQGAPAAGSSGLLTLGETALNLAVNSITGALGVSDYFQPYDYINMDAADQDLGSGGIVLLDPATFSGGGVNKVAVTAGKNGKIYIMNANNLGGYKLGPGQTDGILQTIITNSAVFGAAASYPGEGGFIYFTPVGKATQVYKFAPGANGIPQFILNGQSKELSAGRVGVGVPTVTSLNGQAGTAILWMTDPDVGLRAWNAVPQNGILTSIPLPQIGGANKFQRPAFGDGRLYVTDSNGVLYCLGSPVHLPLNCSSPVDFGQVALGDKVTKNVTCTANIDVMAIVGLQMGNGYFIASNSSLPKGPLTAGASFTFPVTWDLTNAQVTNTQNSSFGSVAPGVKSAPLTLLTRNGAPGYATSFPISLTGTEVSKTPFLTVSPRTVDFGSATIFDPNNIPTTPGIFTIANDGLSNLTVLGYAYTYDELSSSPKYINSTTINGIWDLGSGFTATTLPAIGSIITPNTVITVPSVFNPVNGTGVYASLWQVWSDGGTVNIILEGSAATPPVANFSISDGHGGWLPQSNLIMDFGIVTPGSSSSRQIRICNSGGSSLQIDKSKPPNGVFHISDPAELHESQVIPPGQCAYGVVLFVANTEEYNLPNIVLANSWTLNTNDLNWGVHVVQITGTVMSTKVGPMNSTGSTIYNYLGCFRESTNGPRLFPNEPLAPSTSMNNANCQNSCYSSAKYAFAGTEFGSECWCGNTPPPLASQDPTDLLCNMACPGDPNDRCGATGYISVFYDSTKYVAGTDPSLYGPQTVKTAGNYLYQGCYSESTNGRALAALSPPAPPSGFTIELCQVACQGYLYFGMEYSNQCYCGNTIGVGSVNQTSSVPSVSGCSMICSGNPLEYCGGPNRLNLYMQSLPTASSSSKSSQSVLLSSTQSNLILSSTSTSLPATPTPTSPSAVTSIAGGIYLGCYTEATTGRALSGLMNPIPGATVSVESCATACANAGFTYFGVEYSQECYCGNVINAGSVPASSGCSMTCGAAPMEFCGGPNRLNMYMFNPIISTSKTSSVIKTSPLINSSPVISFSPTSTTLSSSTLQISSMLSSSSLLISLTAMSSPVSTGSRVSSVTLQTSTSSAIPTPKSPITVTNLPGYNYLGCYSEGTNIRALNGLLNPVPGGYVSVEICASACSAYTYFGVEYSGECYCGNVINTGSVNQSSIDPAINGCNMLCNANKFEYCGGGNRLNMYMAMPVLSTLYTRIMSSLATPKSSSTILASSSLISSSSGTSTNSRSSSLVISSTTALVTILGSSVLPSSSTTPRSSPTFSTLITSSTVATSTSGPLWTGTPAINSKIGSWQYMGCANETIGARALGGSSYVGSSMTIESCQSFCTTNNYALAGLEYSSQCYCANSLRSGSFLGQTGCTKTCAGLNTETCGGSSRISVFNNTAYIYPSSPSVVSSYVLQGCYSEATASRLLSGPSYTNSTGMTVESCVSFCTANGANGFVAGVEYGQECYCAGILPSTAILQPASSCNMLCKGNNKEFCGAGGMLNVYRYVAGSKKMKVRVG